MSPRRRLARAAAAAACVSLAAVGAASSPTGAHAAERDRARAAPHAAKKAPATTRRTAPRLRKRTAAASRRIALPIRVNAGGRALLDAAGRSWLADTGYAGGRSVASTAPVADTATPSLYQRARVGHTAYRFATGITGTFAVTLSFAELSGAAPGERVFDIRAEGTLVARDVDVSAAAGQRRAHHVAFTVPVTDGTLDIGFVARRGETMVAGVEVSLLRRPTAPETVFSDDFDGPAGSPPDPARWSRDIGGGGATELQYYTDRTANAALDGAGNLAITARREAATTLGGATRDYTSARLQTYGKVAFTYGRMEARIRVPAGRGLWPAFWALGEEAYRSNQWPAAGEIDAMEVIGSEPDLVHGSLHGPEGGSDYGVTRTLRSPVALSEGFHTYAATWLPGVVVFSLDGRPYGAFTPADLASTRTWSFDGHPFFLLLNLAVGGAWPGSPDATTAFPATMLVDWVRVTR